MTDKEVEVAVKVQTSHLWIMFGLGFLGGCCCSIVVTMAFLWGFI